MILELISVLLTLTHVAPVFIVASIFFGPDVMQSRFGVIFFCFGSASCRKLLANFSANFDGEFDSEFFGLGFAGFRPPKKMHAQNSRPELSAFLSNFTFLNPKFIHSDFSAYGGDQYFLLH